MALSVFRGAGKNVYFAIRIERDVNEFLPATCGTLHIVGETKTRYLPFFSIGRGARRSLQHQSAEALLQSRGRSYRSHN